MPKELTHWMLAERARDALPPASRLAAVIWQHPELYLGGAILPDTLAHIFRGPFHPAAQSLSRRFHNPEGNSYQPLVRMEQCYAHAIPAAELAILLGVISHMEGDMALHPYVYAVAANDTARHYRVETLIDMHFLDKTGGASHRRLDRLLPPRERAVLAKAAHQLFAAADGLPMEAMEHALELHCRFQAMYHNPFWKIAVRVLGKVCGAPYSQQQELFYPRGRGGSISTGSAAAAASLPSHSPGAKPPGLSVPGAGVRDGTWRHPETGEISSSSVDDLAKEAVERTVEVFLLIDEAGSLAAALGSLSGKNLLTGLYGVTKKE